MRLFRQNLCSQKEIPCVIILKQDAASSCFKQTHIHCSAGTVLGTFLRETNVMARQKRDSGKGNKGKDRKRGKKDKSDEDSNESDGDGDFDDFDDDAGSSPQKQGKGKMRQRQGNSWLRKYVFRLMTGNCMYVTKVNQRQHNVCLRSM